MKYIFLHFFSKFLRRIKFLLGWDAVIRGEHVASNLLIESVVCGNDFRLVGNDGGLVFHDLLLQRALHEEQVVRGGKRKRGAHQVLETGALPEERVGHRAERRFEPVA